MSQESNANVGKVDSVNTTGVTLASVNARGLIEGTSIYVIEKACYYILEFNNATTVDHDTCETALGVSGAKWIKLTSGGSGLTPIASNTILSNVTGAPAIPTGNTSAALISAGIIQDPTNVSITGGAITGVNTATRSVQGAMSAADKAFLDDFLTWQKTQYARMVASVAALTGFDAWRVNISTPGIAAALAIGGPAVDAGIEGGAVTANGGGFVFNAPVFQNAAGGNMAFSFRAKIASVSVSGNIGYAGVCVNVGAQTARIWIGVNNGGSATNFTGQVQTNGAATTIVLGAFDTGWHDWTYADDGTTIKFYKDGVLAGSTATRTNLPVGALTPTVYSSATNEIIISRFAIGYVAL